MHSTKGEKPGDSSERVNVAYSTDLGTLYVGDSFEYLQSELGQQLKGKVNLVFTSPPFPLNRIKSYGNKKGQEYIEWLVSYAELFKNILTDDGSVVIEVGNGWENGLPAMSTFGMEALLEFKKRGNFYLCQEFIWHNPARLPSPAQWVNVKRIRVKDAFTRFWWLSTTPYPKADNRNVLTEYSKSMEKLLSRQKYNAGMRPSEHRIGSEGFLSRNKGAIPSNVLTCGNTLSIDPYLSYCIENNIKTHPARMPAVLVEFFIKMLTDPGDLILDPFAGSNMTGYVAEQLDRKWASIEIIETHAKASKARFNITQQSDM